MQPCNQRHLFSQVWRGCWLALSCGCCCEHVFVWIDLSARIWSCTKFFVVFFFFSCHAVGPSDWNSEIHTERNQKQGTFQKRKKERKLWIIHHKWTKADGQEDNRQKRRRMGKVASTLMGKPLQTHTHTHTHKQAHIHVHILSIR